jgi:alkylhydroperoxidase family enzyme
MVKLRVSQINRCAYCIDMHTKKLLAEGSRTSAFTGSRRGAKGTIYSAREQTALAWAEAVTRIAEQRIDDSLYQKALRLLPKKSW